MKAKHYAAVFVVALCALPVCNTTFAALPDPSPQHVYWGAWQIHRANLDGTGATQVADPGGPYGSFVVNRAAGLLYIADGGSLRSFNLSGVPQQTLYAFPSDFYNPDVALDPKRNQLYVNDEVNGAIYRVNANGQNPTQVIASQSAPGGPPHIEEIDIDPIQDKLYWTQWPSASGMQFRRSNLDGTGIQNLFSVNANVSDFALDIGAGKIYWTEFGSTPGAGSVRRANLNGTGQETVANGFWGVAGIALDIPANKLYFSDHWTAGPTNYDGKIYTANLDGSNRQVLLNLGPSDAAKPYYVVLDSLAVPEPSAAALVLMISAVLSAVRPARRARPAIA